MFSVPKCKGRKETIPDAYAQQQDNIKMYTKTVIHYVS